MYSRHIQVYCDKCRFNNIMRLGASIAAVRRDIRSEGWNTTREFDVCPECWRMYYA